MGERVDVAGLRALLAARTPGPWSTTTSETRGEAGTSRYLTSIVIGERGCPIGITEVPNGDVYEVTKTRGPRFDVTSTRLTRLNPERPIPEVHADAALIAAAVNALPALLDRLEACERVVAAVAVMDPWFFRRSEGAWRCWSCKGDYGEPHLVGCAWIAAKALAEGG